MGDMPHPHALRGPARPMPKVDFDRSPFITIWETTRACELACEHCRAEAMPQRYPGELNTEEGKALMSTAAAMGCPIFILTGGDPLKRQDLEELIAHGKSVGLRVGTIPAATASITEERFRSLKAAGLDQVALSLDAPNAAEHDGFRNAPGSFDHVMRGIDLAHKTGIPLQINTCFAEWNLKHLEDMIRIAKDAKVVFWEVFFLIMVGRGKGMRPITADDFERVFARLTALEREVDFHVKLTEAQHLRRYKALAGSAFAGPKRGPGIGVADRAVNAGNGFIFIDHVGDVAPSGFLPTSVGNVRRTPLDAIYREAPLLRDLRDPGKLLGKCGRCEFKRECGGSRARSYAMAGSPFASDPSCAYIPEA